MSKSKSDYLFFLLEKQTHLFLVTQSLLVAHIELCGILGKGLRDTTGGLLQTKDGRERDLLVQFLFPQL